MNTQLIPYTIKTALRIFATLVFGLGLNAFATTGVDVVVPGSANPYLAGMPDGSTASGDTAPTQSPTQVLGLNLSGSAVLTFNATGSVSYGGGSPTDPPDGTQPGSHGPENGLSGFSANWNCLVGVFLDDNQPDGTDAPDPLAFSPDDVAISPGLKQVFFIGDGLTSSGTAQQVNVPAGATRLFLGTTDGYGWYNNSGSFSVHADSSLGNVVLTLPPVTLSITGSTANGSILHFTANTGNHLSVRIQSSLTPSDESSWIDLPDDNGALMAEDPDNAGTYRLDSTFYPTGDAVSFRAIASKTSYMDSKSPALGTFALTRAELSISAKLASATDPVQGAVTHIGEDLICTFTILNSGSATARNLKVVVPVPTYIENQTNLTKQFVLGDIPLDEHGNPTISSGGTFQAESSPDAKDAQIIWDAGDLEAGGQFSESFTIHISNKVRTQQDIGIRNDYTVYGSTFQPPYSATGYSSGSPNVATSVRGPIAFTLVPKTNSVAPGGLVTYTATLTNLTSSVVDHSGAVIEVPAFARFAKSYSKDAKTIVPGVAWTNKTGAPPWKLVYWTGNPTPRVVVLLPSLAARGDSKHLDSISFDITFQAQWVDPAEVTNINAVEYDAAFFDPTKFYDPTSKKFITQYDVFKNALLAAGSTPNQPTAMDLELLLQDTSREIAFSRNDSGIVGVPVTGSLVRQPQIGLLKTISNPATDTVDEDQVAVDSVEPGSQITLLLLAINNGDSAAEDVYVQDRMPDATSFVSAKLIGSSSSTKSSKLAVVPDSDGHHVRFTGLHLEPNDSLCIQYTVQVLTDSNAPALGQFINAGDSVIGSSSTPHTPTGIPSELPIKVVGKALFSPPVVRTLVPNPGVSSNLSATADAMTAIYNSNWSGVPVTNPNDINTFIPGAQRYYIHYANTGSVAATNVTVKFPLPAHTAFYRASFVSLAPNKDKNKADLGYLPGKLISTPSGDSIIPPAGAANGFLATSGVVTFGFSKLAAGAKGDLMVELIVTADAIDQHGSYVGGFDANSANVTIQDSTVSSFGLVRASLTPDVGSHSASAPVAPQQVSSPGNVPQIGILKHVPGEVKAGSNFDMIITVWNYGDTPVSTPVIEYMIPSQNAEFVQMTYGSMTSGTSGITTPGSVLDQNVATNNAPVTGYPWELGPHQSAAITLTYKATGAAGSTIVDNGTKAFAPYCGYVNADITETHITAGTPSSAPLIVLTNSPGHLNLDDNTILIDLRGGNALAVGASGIVAQGGGNIVAQGGGNIVAQGGGNLLPLSSAFASGNNTVGAALTNRSSIVAQGGGNFWATPAAGIVAQGGGNIVAQGGGNIVAAGAGNIVAQGGGNIVAQGGGNIVAQGGGNIVAQGGGNIVAQGGGNFIAVGGGIVAQGGGNIVAQGGGNLVASLANSAALIRTQAGGLISSGGGNFHPTP